MKNKIFTSFLALGMLVMTSVASAGTIIGDLQFFGNAETTTNTEEITSITFDYALVGSASGAFEDISLFTFVDFTNLETITATDSFWSVGGFTFDLTNITENTLIYAADGSATGAYLSGTGTISADGYDDTIFTWSYTTQGIGENDTNKASFSASVPAPAGIALLGFALFGFGATRRNKKS